MNCTIFIQNVDLESYIWMLPSLGQVTQVRLWMPKKGIGRDFEARNVIVKEEDDVILVTTEDMETDPSMSFAYFMSFLLDNNVLGELYFDLEVDYTSHEDLHDFTISFNQDGEIALIYTSNPDKNFAKERLGVEWMKRLAQIDPN